MEDDNSYFDNLVLFEDDLSNCLSILCRLILSRPMRIEIRIVLTNRSGPLHRPYKTTWPIKIIHNNQVDKMQWVSLLLALLVSSASAHNCAGCTPLDTLAFDKVINAFPASLVKFDVAYPYGDDHEEFAKVAKDAATVDRLFIGEVGIKDYGEKDNEDLAARFEVKKEDYPAAILFIRGEEEGTMEHIKFKGKFTAEELKGFVRKNSGIYMPLVGCIEELDKLADELLAGKKEEMGVVIKKAEEVWDQAKGEKAQKRAEIYVKIMKKIEEVGEGFIEKEEARVAKILKGKVSKEKKEEMEERVNILKSFSSAKSGDKDEL